MLLLQEMVSHGDKPVIDYVFRSTAEQERLFAEKKTKCDGVIKKSRHQSAMAADIYFDVDGAIDYGFSTDRAKLCADTYHKFWEKLGGSPMISWDKCHYQIP